MITSLLRVAALWAVLLLPASAEEPGLTFGAGAVIFDQEPRGGEAYLQVDSGRFLGPFEAIASLSLSDEASGFAGAGLAWRIGVSDAIYLRVSVQPGLQMRGEGPDLGSAFNIRSGFEIGYRLGDGMTLGVAVDHRSNAGTAGRNPGMETIGLRLSRRL